MSDNFLEFMDQLTRAGVRVTFEDFQSLPKEAKAALIVTNEAKEERDRSELAVKIATALQGPSGLAWVEKDYDGGDAFVDLELTAALDRHFTSKT